MQFFVQMFCLHFQQWVSLVLRKARASLELASLRLCDIYFFKDCSTPKDRLWVQNLSPLVVSQKDDVTYFSVVVFKGMSNVFSLVIYFPVRLIFFLKCFPSGVNIFSFSEFPSGINIFHLVLSHQREMWREDRRQVRVPPRNNFQRLSLGGVSCR